ncbi:MAG: hypothetical protein MUP22_09635 [Desulfobacterales bacterium]|nr:hypothetical protein [Desulfobacterales bacterium]
MNLANMKGKIEEGGYDLRLCASSGQHRTRFIALEMSMNLQNWLNNVWLMVDNI